MLNERGGFPVVTVDGVFGPTTEQSVKHYQQNENLSVDGIVGKQTWTSLLSKWLLQSAHIVQALMWSVGRSWKQTRPRHRIGGKCKPALFR
jgi:murein L,D-transpeptidase YcbB/YkuD